MSHQRGLKFFLWHYNKRRLNNKKINDIVAKYLFIDCHKYEVEVPLWLTQVIIRILDKQAKDHRKNRPVFSIELSKEQFIKSVTYNCDQQEIFSDVDSRELFLTYHKHDTVVPSWLTKKINDLLEKQIQDYKLRRPIDYNQDHTKDLIDMSANVYFMLSIDQLLDEGSTQEEAIEKLFPGGSFTPLIKKYRKLKKEFGDSPPEPFY